MPNKIVLDDIDFRLPARVTFLQFDSLVQLYTRDMCTHATWHFTTYDVTTVNGFTISPEVSLIFSPSANFRLLRSLRSDREGIICKSNIFWILVFESIVMHCWIKKISVSHFSPTSCLLRTPTSHPFLSCLPYPSLPLFSQAPAPLFPLLLIKPSLLVISSDICARLVGDLASLSLWPSMSHQHAWKNRGVLLFRDDGLSLPLT